MTANTARWLHWLHLAATGIAAAGWLVSAAFVVLDRDTAFGLLTAAAGQTVPATDALAYWLVMAGAAFAGIGALFLLSLLPAAGPLHAWLAGGQLLLAAVLVGWGVRHGSVVEVQWWDALWLTTTGVVMLGTGFLQQRPACRMIFVELPVSGFGPDTLFWQGIFKSVLCLVLVGFLTGLSPAIGLVTAAATIALVIGIAIGCLVSRPARPQAATPPPFTDPQIQTDATGLTIAGDRTPLLDHEVPESALHQPGWSVVSLVRRQRVVQLVGPEYLAYLPSRQILHLADEHRWIVIPLRHHPRLRPWHEIVDLHDDGTATVLIHDTLTLRNRCYDQARTQRITREQLLADIARDLPQEPPVQTT